MEQFTQTKEVIIVKIDPKNSQTSRPYYKFLYTKYEYASGEVSESCHKFAEFRTRGMRCWHYDSFENWQVAVNKAKKQFAEFN